MLSTATRILSATREGRLVSGIRRRALHRLGGQERAEPFHPEIRSFSTGEASFRFWLANRDASWWYPAETLGFGEIRELVRFSRSSKRILEVGSHHGFTAALMASAAPHVTILGVEAHPSNVVVCHAQAGLNGFGERVQFLHCAVSDTANHTIVISDHHNASVADYGISVGTETVDSLNLVHGPFDMLKIDVEGHELHVLAGAKETLSTYPRIALEIHIDSLKAQGIDPLDVIRLIDLGRYTGTMEVRNDRKHLIEFSPDRIPSVGIVNVMFERGQ